MIPCTSTRRKLDGWPKRAFEIKTFLRQRRAKGPTDGEPKPGRAFQDVHAESR
jgi:hypothetical protein